MPLTAVASLTAMSRSSGRRMLRRADFDIYLAEWLGQQTQIFGPLYGVGLVVLAVRWMAASGLGGREAKVYPVRRPI